MRALRLPAPNTKSLMDSLLRSNLRLLVRSPLAKTSRGARPRLLPGAISYLNWSNAGSPRFLENPSCTFALLSDPGRSGWPCLDGQLSAIPNAGKMKTPAFVHFEAQSHGFSTRCLRFKSYVTVCACKACFRLLARLYREGFDPSEFQLMVSVHTTTSPITRLTLALPDKHPRSSDRFN